MGDAGVRNAAILIVEDNLEIRSLVSLMLTTAGYAVREAASGEDAIEIARREHPLLVLLDVRLPGLSGYEVCGWLRDRFRDSVPIIFLSGERTEAFDRAAGLMLGADDYLVKPFSNEELLARVRGLLRRTMPSPKSLAVNLTARELEVLRLLAGGLTQTDIARHLIISTKTVGTHIEHILMKLGVQSRAQAVALAYRDNLLDHTTVPVTPPSPSATPPASTARPSAVPPNPTVSRVSPVPTSSSARPSGAPLSATRPAAAAATSLARTTAAPTTSVVRTGTPPATAAARPAMPTVNSGAARPAASPTYTAKVTR